MGIPRTASALWELDGLDARHIEILSLHGRRRRRAGWTVHETRHLSGGDFVAYLDLAWPSIRWGIECDSLAWHTGKRAHEWDRQRRRRLKQLGWDLVEIIYDDVTKRRSRTGRQLRDLYRLREASLDTSGSAQSLIRY